MRWSPLPLGLLFTTLLLARPAAAQRGLPGDPLALAHGVSHEGVSRYRDPPVNARGRYVVISLEAHRLYVMEGDRVLWDTPVGTGTGTRLESAGQKWEFSTPRGMFRVQLKEKDPLWHVPDWEFIELGQPVPPPDSPKRIKAGQLGTSAMYLEEDVAMHGTSKPELLGQSVSHGCIRMTNEAARRLYHQVDVGTPVLIY
ncbi:MAG TPA: L,D-transpeptidase [Longimicrobiaceae bacterium]|nr:L,D-transpeptidase [Longimicrobiaceae bacterium]